MFQVLPTNKICHKVSDSFKETSKMATLKQDFSLWLNKKLQELKTDETVFGSYIQGILDSDETPEEKSDALQGILSEFVENVSLSICVVELLELIISF